MHRKDLDIRNRGQHTGDLGMLNLEGDICDHGILATTAMSARTRLVATPVFGEVYPPTLRRLDDDNFSFIHALMVSMK